jgi:DNA-binding NarL/FixJ family response regulator
MDLDIRTRECRIIVADGHPTMLRVISDILSAEFPTIATVEDGETLILEQNRIQPALIIADIRLARLNGLQAWQQIRQSNPQCKIIFLSVDDDEGYRMAAIGAGASGWVVKTSVPDELLPAVHRVLAGGMYRSGGNV